MRKMLDFSDVHCHWDVVLMMVTDDVVVDCCQMRRPHLYVVRCFPRKPYLEEGDWPSLPEYSRHHGLDSRGVVQPLNHSEPFQVLRFLLM